jgi:formylglycine-generating enzyme required for sulfatase activity
MKLTIFLLLLSFTCLAQTHMIITGNVFDARTKEPLPFATIGVRGKVEQTISRADGSFRLLAPTEYQNDTLTVSYLGYISFQKKIPMLQSVENIYLHEAYTLLEEVIITHVKLNLRDIDSDLRSIWGNFYAMETEVTIGQYNLFLASLEEQNKLALRKKCEYDLSGYDKATQRFFQRYVTQFHERGKLKDSVKVLHIGPHEWGDYPAVNVTHEGALAYCNWLTEQYNTFPGKKKFKKVKFRLPTLQEWQIAALGYDKFQTWILEENVVEIIIAKDSISMQPRKGERKKIRVGKDILYPWYGAYNYRRSPWNHMGCFLGNFKIDHVEKPCPAKNPAYDGWNMMGRTASYFPNNIGLYDVVGNVAEMIDEKGKPAAEAGTTFPPNQRSTALSHTSARMIRSGSGFLWK